jgi:GH24 family phage-related lysozyme (muramidase)
VTDTYIQTTGKAEYVAPKCDGGSTDPPSTAEPCPTLNAAGTALLKEFEGFVASPEPDPVGLPTVGYGHLCQTAGCGEVSYGFPLTEETATQLLNDDVPRYTACLGDMLSGVTLNDNQWAALASWVFNLGCGATGDSALVRRLNAGEDGGTVVREELPKWVNAGGQQLPGLVRRRDAEIALFNTASEKEAYPTCE